MQEGIREGKKRKKKGKKNLRKWKKSHLTENNYIDGK